MTEVLGGLAGHVADGREPAAPGDEANAS